MKKRLGELRTGQGGTIVQVGAVPLEPTRIQIVQRLMEMGFLDGSWVEVLHEAPFGGDPIAVRVRGTLIALRREEANLVWVEK